MHNGRDAEFTAFVAAQRPRLFRLAYLLAGNQDQAEDIVQRALIKLYASWQRVQGADVIDAYVRRAIVNSHLDESTRPWRRERPGIELVDLPDEPVGLSWRTPTSCGPRCGRSHPGSVGSWCCGITGACRSRRRPPILAYGPAP